MMTSFGLLTRLPRSRHICKTLPAARRATSVALSLPQVDHSHLDRPFSATRQNRYAVEFIQQRPHQRLAGCLSSAAEMKKKGVEPNLVIYNSMLEAAAEDGYWLDAWAILDDMLQVGVLPNAMSFNHVIHSVRFKHNHHLSRVLRRMEECNIKPNSQTLNLLITRYALEGNLEMAIHYLLSVPKHGITPDLQTVQSVIILAARNNSARLALDLATWFEQISTRRLEESVWVNCLIAAAETSYVEGVQQCWNVVTQNYKTVLGEGVCASVLNVAARHGLPQLAAEALQMLQAINIPPQESHFAAIIEAFCRKDQVKEALLVVDLMSTTGVAPSVETTKPISEYLEQDAEKLDTAWQLVEELLRDGRRLSTAAPQAIIRAAVTHGDLPRALAFHRTLVELNLPPDLYTFNLLLQGCVKVADRQMGDAILAEMKAATVKPSQTTYENVIHLCLTQPVYEDAFFYLEEMKATGLKPSAAVYAGLVDKCLSSNDSRSQIALQEMEECGYAVPSSLRQSIGAAADEDFLR